MARDVGGVRAAGAFPGGVPPGVPLHLTSLRAQCPVDVPDPHGLRHEGKSSPSLRQPNDGLDDFAPECPVWHEDAVPEVAELPEQRTGD